MGTWGIGGKRTSDVECVAALTYGLDLGMSLIDTAEMYHGGHSEEVVGQALKPRSDTVFVASKVSPSHFSHDDVLRSARKSLKRLGLKQMDLYQLHWPNSRIPITETMKAMEKLVTDGSIKHIGVSNFSVHQMQEAQRGLSTRQIVSNQVEYSLLERSIESDIIPYCEREGITVIAYSPLAQGKIPIGRGESFTVLDQVASKVGKSRNQVALSWLLHNDQIVVIPKAVKKEHLKENAEVSDFRLSHDNHKLLSRAFV